MKKILASLTLISIVVLGYYTHRLWVFASKVSYGFEYTYAAIDCLIQESGQNESDVEILYKGYKSRKEYADAINKEFPGAYGPDSGLLTKRKIYNGHIPECKIFYSQYRCWELDSHDPKSLDGCGKHFGLNQDEIDTMKKDPSTIDKIMNAAWERRKKESK